MFIEEENHILPKLRRSDMSRHYSGIGVSHVAPTELVPLLAAIQL